MRLLICVCVGGCDWAAQGPLSRPPHTPRSFVGALMPCLGVRKRITRQIAVSPLHPPGPAALPPSAVSSVTQLGPLPTLFPRPPPSPATPYPLPLAPEPAAACAFTSHKPPLHTNTSSPRSCTTFIFTPFPSLTSSFILFMLLEHLLYCRLCSWSRRYSRRRKKKRERKKQGDLLVLMAVTCWLGGHRQKRRVEIVWLDAHEWLWGRGMKGE